MICDLNTRWSPPHPAGKPTHRKDLFGKVFLFCLFLYSGPKLRKVHKETINVFSTYYYFADLQRTDFSNSLRYFLPYWYFDNTLYFHVSPMRNSLFKYRSVFFYNRLTLSKQYFIFPESSKFVTSNPRSRSNAFVETTSPLSKGLKHYFVNH